MENESNYNKKIFLKDSQILLFLERGGKEIVYQSKNGIDFSLKKEGVISNKEQNIHKVPDYKYEGRHLAYKEDENICILFSKDSKTWKKGKISITPRKEYFDNSEKLHIGCVELTKEGIVVIYYVKTQNRCKFGALVFDRQNPQRLLHRTKTSIWECDLDESTQLIGVVYTKNKLHIYRDTESGVTTSLIPFSLDETHNIVEKASHNPIIEPTENSWECNLTFNPAVFEHNGKVHLLYRAIGKSNISALGHAISHNGVNIHTRKPKPIYTHTLQSPITKDLSKVYLSGRLSQNLGAFGGCEDPRVTKIEDKLVMLYTAFEGYPRVALTHINISSFLEGKSSWEKPHLTPKGEVQKNWVLFPEKIKGKYAILHSVSPKIGIDYIEELNFNKPIKSTHLKIEKNDAWHNIVRGVGAPPIKTERGWLVFYHAHSKGEYGKYKLGALLLDVENPEKILHKSQFPILVPNSPYETSGFKPGVVYCCGAVVLDGTLFIYYGGADSVVCVAKKDLKEFLHQLITNKQVHFVPIKIKNEKRRVIN